MARILVLGGTAWIGRSIAAGHVARGHEVVCLARAERGDAPGGAALLRADRDEARAYEAAAGDWDEVVDLTSTPAHAASAVDALGDRARHWTFVSSVSAQRLEGAPEGADEDDPLVDEDPSGEDYGGAKAWIERMLQARLGDRLAIVRPGLVCGPGDGSDRFGYWPARAALAGEGPLLVPARDEPVQAIDVRDLVAFVVDVAPTLVGVVNATGPRTTLHEIVRLARAAAGHEAGTGALVLADDDALDAAGVAPWMGPGSLPLHLPASLATHAQRSSARYLAAGGRHTPLERTIADVLADERERDIDRPRRSGLTRAEELAVIDSLASGA